MHRASLPVALLMIFLAGPGGPAARAGIISINFEGGTPTVAPTSMAPSDVAGVVPGGFWNNAPGSNGQLLGLTEDAGGVAAATGASVNYMADNTNATGIDPTSSPNARLMKGYLDTGTSSPENPSTTTITVSGIPFATYDVYVYTDGDNSSDRVETRAGLYTLNGGAPMETFDPAGQDFSGTFILGQNYTVFQGVTGDSFVLQATPDTSVGSSAPRAPVNGIQIVAPADTTVVPEPATLGLAALGGVGLLGFAWRARRRA